MVGTCFDKRVVSAFQYPPHLSTVGFFIINEKKHYHVVTIEDPIEYLHSHKNSTINQREVGHDIKDFPSALRASLRQAPKVILVGEMRDKETIEVALGGRIVTQTVEDRNRFPVRIRYARAERQDEETVKRLLVNAGGTSFPLVGSYLSPTFTAGTVVWIHASLESGIAAQNKEIGFFA